MSGPILLSYVALWLVVSVETIAILALYHHFAQMYLTSREGRATQGPVIGSRLRPIEGETLTGTLLQLPAAGVAGLLVFVSTKCPLCDRLRPDMARFDAANAGITMIVICQGRRQDVHRWAGNLADTIDVVIDPKQLIGGQCGVGLLPFCIGVDSSGVVRAKGIINDSEGLEAIAGEALESRTVRRAAPVLQEVGQ